MQCFVIKASLYVCVCVSFTHIYTYTYHIVNFMHEFCPFLNSSKVHSKVRLKSYRSYSACDTRKTRAMFDIMHIGYCILHCLMIRQTACFCLMGVIEYTFSFLLATTFFFKKISIHFLEKNPVRFALHTGVDQIFVNHYASLTQWQAYSFDVSLLIWYQSNLPPSLQQFGRKIYFTLLYGIL